MNYLTTEQLQKLPTRRLLAYKAKLLKTPAYVCSCGSAGCFALLEEDASEGRGTKSDPAWNQAYADVKDVLKTREHVPREKDPR